MRSGEGRVLYGLKSLFKVQQKEHRCTCNCALNSSQSESVGKEKEISPDDCPLLLQLEHHHAQIFLEGEK